MRLRDLAIDGPAGSGKSTVARRLARHLHVSAEGKGAELVVGLAADETEEPEEMASNDVCRLHTSIIRKGGVQ